MLKDPLLATGQFRRQIKKDAGGGGSGQATSAAADEEGSEDDDLPPLEAQGEGGVGVGVGPGDAGESDDEGVPDLVRDGSAPTPTPRAHRPSTSSTPGPAALTLGQQPVPHVEVLNYPPPTDAEKNDPLSVYVIREAELPSSETGGGGERKRLRKFCKDKRVFEELIPSTEPFGAIHSTRKAMAIRMVQDVRKNRLTRKEGEEQRERGGRGALKRYHLMYLCVCYCVCACLCVCRSSTPALCGLVVSFPPPTATTVACCR
jgi:hypothetical protein